MANVADKPSMTTGVVISTEKGKTRIDYYSPRTMKSFVLFTEMSPDQAAECVNSMRVDAMLDAFVLGTKTKIVQVRKNP